jgi:hypothetical protein
MGHFAAVQNLLRFIGAPLNLEREDFPFRIDLYPFRFRLEPFSQRSLARYLAAEMPATSGGRPAAHRRGGRSGGPGTKSGTWHQTWCEMVLREGAPLCL